MVEVLIVLILATACITVFGMILCFSEVTWFAKEMFTRILNTYDKKHSVKHEVNKNRRT